ncbi:mitochondrial import inner membrane translocase subunit TIM44-2-like [Coffea eugenioides]|uniref:Mitochondrial import inner membrane translocase subunit TIM44-2-like n=1 Tax=Coffea arabica TaxID=13443 RepID=A0A6P6V0G7_COFAR|nr:mitochondrial import inner membrane translocase subunit TIM44-2-like [Coffea eugenioides]
MASKKLVRDLFIARQPLFRQLLAPQMVSSGATRLRLTTQVNGFGVRRQFSVFNEFSNKIKGEASKNQDFQQSVKELKEKAEELKGVKEDLKARTKQTTEQLYKHVDGVWTEAESTAKKVYTNVEEKISAAKAEVKESFGFRKEESSESTRASENIHSDGKDGGEMKFGEQKQQEQHQQSGPSDNAGAFFDKFKSGVSSVSAKASMAFQKVKEAKPIDIVKKGYDIVKDELKGNAVKRKHLEHSPQKADPSIKVGKSTRTDLVILPSKQSKWGKKWDTFMEKMRGHPLYKRVRGMSEPVVTKSQEIAEDVRERWDTSDHPVVHKIQDLNETVFGETDTAMSFKEIRQRDPSFSLPEFVSEVQEVVKPVLNAYFKKDFEVLKKYCSSEVVERCKAEHNAFESQDIFFDHKILHISDVEVRETKMMGDSPIIIVTFQTQQIYCVRDRHGAVTEGGKDTIHTVYYAWAMQQVPPEELGEGAIYPIWRLREMQQFGVQALI